MIEVTINEYEEYNLVDVQQLILGIQRDEFLVDVTIEDQPDLNRIPKFYQTNKGNFWVAKFNNKVIGTIALLDIGHGQGALRKMFVNQDFRGKPFCVGQKLLDELLKWALDSNFQEIFLGTTEKYLAAHRFYEKNGFSKVDKNTLPIKFPIMDVDKLFYKINLSKIELFENSF